ncbi:lysozyme inhibitor LprI family protein [Burkholderia ubonensis]|uniref:lysozyme inhibitor LprI family protein n=1 Tax=Burkholderia ubonensis TaxID=101571 RepID=UPI000AF0E7C6|nr:lysozyme inhibitor LprI family protein [Burkholderia ubonensis]
MTTDMISIPLPRAGRLAASLCVAALSWLPVHAAAASFDCRAARTDVERAICGDAELSRLDEQLDDTYRVALSLTEGETRNGVRTTQRAWLKSLQPTNARIDVRVLKDAYRRRIDELQDLPDFPDAVKNGGGSRFRLDDVSSQFDFNVRMYADCPTPKGKDSETCNAPGQISVYRKGAAKPLQTIDMPMIFATLMASGKPLANSARLYDYQGVINVGDFNFDGHDDFGVQTGHEGSYGGPSYDVYVFDPNGGKFILNDAMSELTRSSLGFFDVDTKNKRLRTLGKSGCCYHVTTAYRVERNRPVAVERHIEDGMRGDGRMAIIDERLVNGKWQRKVRYLSQ